ncbi:MAG: SlyX family protein [Spirochaetes bacterium]|nr:SlyX family protein [Spirochaetota bacterium]
MSETEEMRIELADLQSKYSFQQEMIDSLNDTVVKQWAAIDKLTKMVGECADHIMAVSASLDGEGNDPPPPHY